MFAHGVAMHGRGEGRFTDARLSGQRRVLTSRRLLVLAARRRERERKVHTGQTAFMIVLDCTATWKLGDVTLGPGC